MDTGTATKDPAEVGIQLIKASMPQTFKSIQAKAAEVGNAAYGLVRRGLRGEANCFWACERGNVVGTPFTEDAGITSDVARVMVTFAPTFIVIWQKASNGAN